MVVAGTDVVVVAGADVVVGRLVVDVVAAVVVVVVVRRVVVGSVVAIGPGEVGRIGRLDVGGRVVVVGGVEVVVMASIAATTGGSGIRTMLAATVIEMTVSEATDTLAAARRVGCLGRVDIRMRLGAGRRDSSPCRCHSSAGSSHCAGLSPAWALNVLLPDHPEPGSSVVR